MPGKNSMPYIEELQAIIMNSGEDFLRKSLEKMLNLIMELEVEAKTNLEPRRMVSAMIRTIFAQEGRDAAKQQLRNVVSQLEGHYPTEQRDSAPQ